MRKPLTPVRRAPSRGTAQLLLAATVWVAHFFHANRFGVYEDDWNRIPYTAGISWHQLLALIRQAFRGDFSQGRPLHVLFIDVFSFLGFKTGSLLGLYAIGFALETVNAWLFYALLSRVCKNRNFALLGALAFCLFPADTTQPFLTHAFGVQTALCLLLLALHSYLAGWRVLSYAAAWLLLFTYETPFLVFAAAPLLDLQPRRKRWKHWSIMGALLLSAFLFRQVAGESRVSHMTAWQVLAGCSNMVTGPLTCMAMYVYRPLEALCKLRGWDWATTLLAILAFRMVAEYTFRGDVEVQSASPDLPIENLPETSSAPDPARTGLWMLLLAYPLTLTTAGISVAGRGTRVHTAAALGSSMVFAAVCQHLLLLKSQRPVRTWAVAGVLGLMAGFGLVVQHDYALSWQEQRAFWTSLVRIAPPLHDGEVILVEPSGLHDRRQLLFLRKDLTGTPDTRQIKSLDTLLTGLPALYRMPPEWKQPPQVFRLPLGWQQQIFTADDHLRLLTIEAPLAFDPASRTPVAHRQAVLLTTQGGQLSRATTLVNPLTSHTLQLNSTPGPIINLPRSAFARYVVSPRLDPPEPQSPAQQP